jgi:sulfur relay protein TusB/DsrH
MLIILSKSPFASSYESVLKLAENASSKGEKVAVLHIQDACVAATMERHCMRLADARIRLYALKTDCEARGLLDKLGKDVKVIDHREWVRLLMKDRENIVSWTS